MPHNVYNFIWVVPGAINYEGKAALQVDNTARRPQQAKAVILYPALLTPLVHSKGKSEWLELLIVSDLALTPEMVNWQLKLSVGLKSIKAYSASALFGGPHGNIEVEAASFDGDGIIKTHANFSGILHKSAKQYLKDNKLDKYHRVRVHARLLDLGGRLTTEAAQRKVAALEENRKVAALEDNRKSYQSDTTQDAIIRALLEKRVGKDTSLPEKGLYCFATSDQGVDLSQADKTEPIQSYNPVFVFSEKSAFDYANFGHLSDIHINSRLDLLYKSPARVIDYDEAMEKQFPGESTPISRNMARTGTIFSQLLSQFGTRQDAHAVLIGGDLIDHIKNAYSSALLQNEAPTAGEVWEAVNLNRDYEKKHPACLDFIVFYSIILNFCRSYRKPVFSISGNHDCYLEAFGIAPRALGSRANEGIPADLNLTLYEALLLFGQSFDEYKESFNFEPDYLDWFYTVFTPFSDWWVKFPKQSLVALAWGDEEDMFKDPNLLYDWQWSIGHLPRSPNGVSDEQLALLEMATAEHNQRKVTLVTHFTFLSYQEDIPLSGGKPLSDEVKPTEGSIVFAYNKYGMGSFETNRGDMIELLNGRKIQCIMTGHSHRRALYQIKPKTWYLDPTNSYSYDPARYSGSLSEPAIVVSDSGGPYPRYNFNGEFMGWGSDKPSGTLVEFNAADGNMKKLHVLKGSCSKPRIAVAMDYLDIIKREVFAQQIMTEWFEKSKEGKHLYALNVMLSAHVTRELRLQVEQIVLIGKTGPQAPWMRIPLTEQDGNSRWLVAQTDTPLFKRWALSDANRFIAFRFKDLSGKLSKHYDFRDPWIFEVSCTTGRNQYYSNISRYILHRPSDQNAGEGVLGELSNVNYPEVPNYAWRKKCFPERYGR